MAAAAPGADHLFCEKCGLKVRLHAKECPRCFGPLVRRNASEAVAAGARAQKEHERRREVRAPLVVGAAAVVVAVTGTVFGLARGASVPLVVDPVTIGRPTAGAPPAVRAREPGDVDAFDVALVEGETSARDAFRRGDFEHALAAAQATLARRPDDLNALNNAGQALVRLERAAEAASLLERAVTIAPESWMAQFNLARALAETGRWPRAADHYLAASVLMPGHYPTLFNLAFALQRSGRDEAAVEAFGRAAAADSGQADPWLALAAAHERLGHADLARDAFTRFLELAPADSAQRSKVEQRLAALVTGVTPSPSPRSAPTAGR